VARRRADWMRTRVRLWTSTPQPVGLLAGHSGQPSLALGLWSDAGRHAWSERPHDATAYIGVGVIRWHGAADRGRSLVCRLASVRHQEPLPVLSGGPYLRYPGRRPGVTPSAHI